MKPWYVKYNTGDDIFHVAISYKAVLLYSPEILHMLLQAHFHARQQWLEQLQRMEKTEKNKKILKQLCYSSHN